MTINPAQFTVHPSSGVPIYRQVIDQVQALLTGGQLQTGDMLPSVRQMATELGVNPMTISKAYARLEVEGVVERVRGKGMMLRDQPILGSVPDRLVELSPLIEAAVVRGRQLGLNDKQIQQVLNKVLKENPQ